MERTLMEITYWFITIASLIGTIANIYKKQWCFAIWLGTNVAWTIIDFQKGIYAQATLFAIYTCLAIWGLYKWKK
jgi:nicotinamide riboside transporter PnuC